MPDAMGFGLPIDPPSRGLLSNAYSIMFFDPSPSASSNGSRSAEPVEKKRARQSAYVGQLRSSARSHGSLKPFVAVRFSYSVPSKLHRATRRALVPVGPLLRWPVSAQ